MSIGNNTIIYNPRNTIIDETRPWLIKIGDYVKITDNVTILTHGYDWSVLNVQYKEVLGSSGKVEIGNNVFIGMKTTILKGVKIGNNVIIGANSLINKDIPSNVVVAGNPAKVICTIEEYYKKRKEAQEKEAEELTIEYYKKYKVWPSRQILREFLFLFDERNEKTTQDEVFKEVCNLNNNIGEVETTFLKQPGKYKSYEEFIEHCKRIIKEK